MPTPSPATGRDEYSQPWPLFFAPLENKNPTIIYLLAGLFRVTGPSIAVLYGNYMRDLQALNKFSLRKFAC